MCPTWLFIRNFHDLCPKWSVDEFIPVSDIEDPTQYLGNVKSPSNIDYWEVSMYAHEWWWSDLKTTCEFVRSFCSHLGKGQEGIRSPIRSLFFDLYLNYILVLSFFPRFKFEVEFRRYIILKQCPFLVADWVGILVFRYLS